MKTKNKYGSEGMDGKPVVRTQEDMNRVCEEFEKYGWEEVLVGGCPTRTYDVVTNPSHYCQGRKYEPKDVIRDWGLNYNLGCAVKYISRAGRKGDALEDLRKARQYLDFEIDALMKESE